MGFGWFGISVGHREPQTKEMIGNQRQSDDSAHGGSSTSSCDKSHVENCYCFYSFVLLPLLPLRPLQPKNAPVVLGYPRHIVNNKCNSESNSNLLAQGSKSDGSTIKKKQSTVTFLKTLGPYP